MKNIVRAGCIALMFVVLLLPVLSVRTQASDALPELRYGTGDERDAILSANDLFALLYPDETPLTDAEIAYFGEANRYSFRYRSDIPDSIIETVYSEEERSLTVLVPAYSYPAENGKTVVWIPETVSMEGTSPLSLTFDGERYTAVYRNVPYADPFVLTVTFAWQTKIPAAEADALLTKTATVAAEALAVRLAYAEIRAAYDEQKAEYDAYTEAKTAYDERKAAYDAYVPAKATYDEQKAAYDAYTEAKSAYDAALADYEQNRARKEAYEHALTAYYAYEAQRQQNTALYDRYEAYLDALKRMDSRLAVLESMFVFDSHGWIFYNSLVGETVSSILERRTELQSLGVSGTNVDNAKNATDALRELMQNYQHLRQNSYATELEKKTELFRYYTEHYEELRDQTAKLFENVLAIYSDGSVQRVMENTPQSREKMPHFRQFLAQLYVLTCCLNDIETLDLSWTIPKNGESLVSLLEEPLLLTDSNQASPVGVTVPTEEVSLGGSLPEPAEKPEKNYTEVEDPRLFGEPEVVANPGEAPTEVANPGEEPEVVANPGETPVLALTEAELLLANEHESGKLPIRSPRGEEQPLTLLRNVTAYRSAKNSKMVTFYDWNGTVVSVQKVNAINPPTLERSDGAYYYTFLGWVRYGSNEETPIGFAGITTNLSLSPLFSRREKIYTVKWIISGQIEQPVETQLKYGEMPVCPVDPAWNGETSVSHAFLGWDREIEPVTANAIYTAQYENVTPVYAITWDLGDRTETEWLPYDATPVYSGQPTRTTDGNSYEFRGWSPAIVRVRGSVTYTAVWRKTPLIANALGKACRAEHAETTVTVYPEDDVFDITAASDYARNVGKDLLLQKGDLTISLSAADMERLSDSFCTQLEFVEKQDDTEESTRFRIVCRNSLGREVGTGLSFSVTVRYPATDGLYTMAYRVEKNGTRTALDLNRYAGGRSTFTVKEGDEVICRPEYLLQYTDETDNCNPTLLLPSAPKGTEVLLATDCAYGYEISGATLIFASGRVEEVGTTFQMPAERVQVLLHVTPITYHITFVVDGQIVSEQTRLFGEEVEIPADPRKEDADGCRYLFAGWSPYVTRATGDDREPVYTAIFSVTPLPLNQTPVKRYGLFRSPLFFAAIGVVLLVVSAVVLIAFRKKIFRKRSESAAAAKEK